jgi:hypothetical protein
MARRRDNDEHRIMTAEDMNAQQPPISLQEVKGLKVALQQSLLSLHSGYGNFAEQVRAIKELATVPPPTMDAAKDDQTTAEQFSGLDRLCQVLFELEVLYPTNCRPGKDYEQRMMKFKDMKCPQPPIALQEVKELKRALERYQVLTTLLPGGYGFFAEEVRAIKELAEQVGSVDRLCQVLLELESLYPTGRR